MKKGLNKKEPIIIISFLLRLFFLFFTAAHFSLSDKFLFIHSILPVYIILLLCLFIECFVEMENFFIIFSVLHLIALLMVFRSIGLDNPFINITLSFFFFLTIALRLHLFLAVPYNVLSLILLVLAIPRSRGGDSANSFYYIFLGGVFLAFVHVVTYYRDELIKSRRTEVEKDQSLDKLETVSESLLEHLTEIREESAEEERYRITRELHDSLGYSMTNIISIMNAVKYLYDEDPDRVKRYCEKTSDMAAATMDETRETLYKLREITREIPRNPALFFDKMCREFQEATGIETRCEGGNFTEQPPERLFSTIYRIVQVGFINALKHGETEKIILYFWVDPDELRMTVWNNINHIVPSDRLEEGIGLKGVRERLNILGGRLEVTQTLEGFSLNITMPLWDEEEREWNQ